ncbi:MAG TPA: TetR family transcriptional regulator, partial [Caulobacteraceae bacterium]|nr:TetR family transcriptional regulator [Caulobacteraceae bacterium]
MKTPAPAPNLRDRQREETREQILRAVGHQLEQGPLEDLSFAEIAKDARVGERTVYRYFPTKEALLGAFWAWMQSQAVAPPEPKPKPPRSLPRIREAITAPHDAGRPMRILLATDAWEPQVNGVVRTLTRVVAELKAMGHSVEVISPDQFKTFPLPTYAEIKVAIGVYEPVQERFKAFEPEAIHIATEGPI